MSIVIDVHGLYVDEALKKIKTAIISNYSANLIEVIHGYNKGFAIKNALKEEGKHLSKRVSQVIEKPSNGGITLIYLK